MGPLKDILVVSVEQAVAAPMCTARLAAAGARVIKIEREEGDFARGYDRAAKGESSYFTWLNQGKESVCLDFKTEEGAKTLRDIIKKADVFVQNLSPGALARSGFSADDMLAINPKLIVCNISGYGLSGDAAKKRAYDLLVQAESGLISVSGSPDSPGRIGVSICDIGAGVTAYGGILEALIKRGQSGVGDVLSVSLFDVAAEWMAVPYIHAEYGDGAPRPVGLRHPSIAPYGAFECSDGRLVLISIQNEREWRRLCEDVLQSSQLLGDEKYGSNNDRVANVEELEAEISAVTGTLTSTQFQDRLETAKVAYGAINTASDLRSHPAFRSAVYMTSGNRRLDMPAGPVQWNSQGEEQQRRAPRTGEHTKAVVDEFSGAKT